MQPYIFFRKEGFYPIDLEDDAEARENAECNPGTLRVENILTREVVWSHTPYWCRRCRVGLFFATDLQDGLCLNCSRDEERRKELWN